MAKAKKNKTSKKSGTKKRNMPAALRKWAAKNARKKGRKGRRGSRGGRGLVGAALRILRGGVAAGVGVVASAAARKATVGMHKGNPIGETLVSVGTAVALDQVGARVARSLPIVRAEDAQNAALGAGLDAAFVGTQKLRAAGKIPGVPNDRRGVLAGESAPSPSSGTDTMLDLVKSW